MDPENDGRSTTGPGQEIERDVERKKMSGDNDTASKTQSDRAIMNHEPDTHRERLVSEGSSDVSTLGFTEAQDVKEQGEGPGDGGNYIG